VTSKAILAKAMTPGDALGLYGFRRCKRGSDIARSLMVGVVILHWIKSSRNSTLYV
jgi:hypothetical protein